MTSRWRSSYVTDSWPDPASLPPRREDRRRRNGSGVEGARLASEPARGDQAPAGRFVRRHRANRPPPARGQDVGLPSPPQRGKHLRTRGDRGGTFPRDGDGRRRGSVSYTHLTLPTSDL